MTPADFFRLHGLLVDHPINDGRWHRVPTDDHPKKRNGAYLLDGDRAVCQNWATMPQAESMRRESGRTATPERIADRARERAEREREIAADHKRAAARAQAMLDACRPWTHGYLARKGFPDTTGLVMPDEALFVPMRDASGELVGAQAIRWDADERVWDKKFLPGQKSAGARFVLGSGREAFLCEGLATGLSIEAALRSMQLPARVIVCFSAHNVASIGSTLALADEPAFVVAEHDPPQRDPAKWHRNPGEAGQRAAVRTGLRWTMSPNEGEDANDMHQKRGLRHLASLLMNLRRSSSPPAWQPADPPAGCTVNAD